MSHSARNGVGKVFAYLNRFDSTLLTYVAWDGQGGGAAGSTQVSVSSLAGNVQTSPQSTVWAGNAGFHFDGSGALLTAGGAGGSSQVTISQALDSSGGGVVFADSANNALRVNVVAGSAAGSTTVNVSSLAGKVLVDQNSTVWPVQVSSVAGVVNVQQNSTVWAVQLTQYSTTAQVSSVGGVVSVSQNSTVWAVQLTQYSTVVLISGNSTVIQGTNPWTIAGNCTVAPLAGSTWSVRPVQSSRADLQVTAFNSDNLGNLIESSTNAGSGTNSTRRGIVVRQAIPDCTNASAQAGSSGDVTVISSAANTIYVYAYSLSLAGAASTAVGGIACRFLSGSTAQIWRVQLGVSGTSTGGFSIDPAALAVSPPGYLFKTAASAALTLNTTSSGVVYSVAAFRE